MALAQGPHVTAQEGRTASGGKWRIERRTPGLLSDLNDVVTRQTRLGGGSGHRKRGDEMPAPYLPDTANGKKTPQGRAAELQHAARNSLTTIVRDLCETQGLQPPAASSPAAACWLAQHAHWLACDDAAGLWKSEIRALVKRIEKVIDYPELPRQIGPCPIFDKTGNRCNQELRARRDQQRINCPKCGVNQDVKSVTKSYLERNRHRLFRLSQIEQILNQIEEPVSLRTLQRWHKRGYLKARGYWRPDGNRGTMRRSDADVPGFWLEDARRIREKSARMPEAGS
ncbi:hypothetical protein [Mycobacterium marinum]|uniref:hypothetical protein n=1 Tax=Mycobacterium marinum TaxID=1781 RepID=UPI00356347DB